VPQWIERLVYSVARATFDAAGCQALRYRG
jgi:hypothetical protein